MNRTEFEDRMHACRRELEALQAVHADMGCRTCWHYAAPTCGLYKSPVPAEFVPNGCDQWDYNDVPF